MKKKIGRLFGLAAISAALLVGGTAGIAQALPSVNDTLFTGYQTLSDNSGQYLIDMGNGAPNTVDIGDRIRGILTIHTVEQSPNLRPLGGIATNELTGVFDMTVVSKVAGGMGWNFGFVPTALGLSGFGAYGAPVGTGLVAFEDVNGNDYNRGLATIALSEATATDGNVFWYIGFAGLAGEFWMSTAGTDDPSLFAAMFPSPIVGGFFNFGGTQLPGGTGPVLGLVPCLYGPVNYCGSGSLLAPLGGAYPIWDNVDVTINNPIPEPTTVLLLGAGLVGLGLWGRKRMVK